MLVLLLVHGAFPFLRRMDMSILSAERNVRNRSFAGPLSQQMIFFRLFATVR
jgi:hypothetical protein